MKVHIIQECREETYEEYKEMYEKRGLKYCYETGSLYYIAEMPFMPLEGQRLGTRFGLSIVDHAHYAVEEDEKDDFLFYKTYISVHDE